MQEEFTNVKYLVKKHTTSPGTTTGQSVSVISTENPWLASPDGLVTDPTENLPQEIVEFKILILLGPIPFMRLLKA